jgi:hypothetical protein
MSCLVYYLVALEIGFNGLLAHSHGTEHSAKSNKKLIIGLQDIYQVLEAVVVLQDVVAVDQLLSVAGLFVILHSLIKLVTVSKVISNLSKEK